MSHLRLQPPIKPVHGNGVTFTSRGLTAETSCLPPSFRLTNAWTFDPSLHYFSIFLLSDQGKIPAPAFHAFTGTEFTTPEAMHGALWLAVGGEKDVEEGTDIEKKLSAKLKYRQKTPTVTSPMLVVVLDEIDQLMTQNRQVLRKLFEWADAPKSRLVSQLRRMFPPVAQVD